MISDRDLIQKGVNNEENKAAEAYGTNRGIDDDANLLSANRTGEMQGMGLLEGNRGVTSSGNKTKELEGGVTVHKYKNFRVIEDAQKIKEIEIKKAREEEKKEVQALLNLPQSAVPKGWDYLVLPRKINVQRVPLPPTIMKEDYFEPVKALVSGISLNKVIIVITFESSWHYLCCESRSNYSHAFFSRCSCLPLARAHHLVRCWHW